MKAYRVFYRQSAGYSQHRQEVIWGDDELTRRLALKRPKVIHHEIAMVWRCEICRKRGPWTKHWRRMPQQAEGGTKAAWNRKFITVCSDECAEQHWPGRDRNRILPHDDREPVAYTGRWQKLLKARYAAFGAERNRVSELRDHRRFPMFKHGKGDGWCRWCGKAVAKPRRTWHEDCLQQFNLHTSLDAQQRFLIQRDGRACKVEGCETDGTEVDHVVPLWRTRGMSDDERRPFHGPDNLQLLCIDHHKEKTAREAGERAREGIGSRPSNGVGHD